MTALRDDRRAPVEARGQVTKDQRRRARVPFVPGPSSFVIFIVVAYLVIGALYALKTPAWQVPDEPAHYNYVRFIAQGRGLPVLQPGDYDPDYLERIKAAGFPPFMPVDSIRYESWQPPLYYILAAPVYLVTGGSLLALRLFSLALGGLLVVIAFVMVRRVAPGAPALALGTAAFVAFVPQHVAMMAGAQNDSLAELLLALVVFQISSFKLKVSNARWVATGVLLGLGLVTKATVYIGVLLVAAAVWLVYRSQPNPRKWTWLIRPGVLVLGPALVLGSLWWVRNVAVYGWPDFLVSIRHDAVVAGQPTPADWVSKLGWGEYLRQYIVTTFHSFWGQFGWMGVPMNAKYYAVLALVSLAAFIGFVWFLNGKFQASNLKGHADNPNLRFEIWHWIFVAWILLALITYIGYNAKYVQFQGRYLFPALIPIGLAFTVGLRQWTTLLPRAWRDAALAVPFAGLAALDLVALFRMIIPTLAR